MQIKADKGTKAKLGKGVVRPSKEHVVHCHTSDEWNSIFHIFGEKDNISSLFLLSKGMREARSFHAKQDKTAI